MKNHARILRVPQEHSTRDLSWWLIASKGEGFALLAVNHAVGPIPLFSANSTMGLLPDK